MLLARLSPAVASLLALALAGVPPTLAPSTATADVPGAIALRTAVRLEAADRESAVTVFRPRSPPIGLVMVAHGFSRSGDRHTELARALAEAGFLVAVPDLPYFSNHAANAVALRDLAHAVARLTPDAPADLPIVLVGFSAGGLASLLSAHDVVGLSGWIGLDPVDLRGQGSAAAASLAVPALVLRAPPSGCNANGNGAGIAAALPPGTSEDFVVPGASHCDFEDPTSLACVVACGTDDAERRESIRRAVVSAALQMVHAGRP
jgi:pimeloyl-ACP methyl ester carboxylesterase